MARYNVNVTRTVERGPVKTLSRDAPDTVTFEGAAGWLRDEKSELFLAAVTDLNESFFYETSGERRDRTRRLVERVAVADPEWVLGLVGWLRGTAGLRSSAVNVAVAAARARTLSPGHAGVTRRVVDAAIARADEPAEVLACWVAAYGRGVPSAVKRGVGDGVRRTWNEGSVLKWRGKGARGGVDMRDVLNLTHPAPGVGQAALFEAVLADAYGRAVDDEALPIMRARRAFLALSRDEQVAALLADGSTVLRDARLTHEVVSSALGDVPAAVWEVLVPGMGYTALLMNLRRIADAGVDRATISAVNERIGDPDAVRRSGVMPVRFLSAYRYAPLVFAAALQDAMDVSTRNVPVLPGRSLVLVDCSGSMGFALSERGTLTRMDAAAVFGAALALRGEDVDLVAFGTGSRVVAFRRGDGVLRLAERMTANMGGTHTRDAVSTHYSGHDRVVVLTDEQATGRWILNRVFASVPEEVHAFTWNLAGYGAGHAATGSHRHVFGGLSDAGFDLIQRVEAGFAGGWPWEK